VCVFVRQKLLETCQITMHLKIKRNVTLHTSPSIVIKISYVLNKGFYM